MEPTSRTAIAYDRASVPAGGLLRYGPDGRGKLHDFRDDDFGHGVFPAAVELQHVADPMKRRSHSFDMFGVDVVFRERHGCIPTCYYAPKERRLSVRQRTHQEKFINLVT